MRLVGSILAVLSTVAVSTAQDPVADFRRPEDHGELTGFVTLDDESFVVARTSLGVLHRIRLKDGVTSVTSVREVGKSFRGPRRVGHGRFVTWTTDGRVRLWRGSDLTVIASGRVESAKIGFRDQSLEIDHDGSHVLVTSKDERPARIVELVPGSGTSRGREVLELEGEWSHSAFSSNGKRAVFARQDRLRVVDVSNGECVRDIDVELVGKDERIDFVEFVGDDRVVIGWGSKNWSAGLRVVDLELGEIVERRLVDQLGLGNAVAAIESYEDLGVVIAASRDVPDLSAFGSDFELRWSLMARHGNPSILHLSRADGSQRLCTYGVGPEYSRVLDLSSGEVLSSEKMHGLVPLAETGDGRFFVGLRDGELLVFGGSTLERVRVIR